MTSSSEVSLPYKELGIEQILILSLFLLLLNIMNAILDRVIYCGLLGPVLLGIVFDTPGTQWLYHETEEAIGHLGSLGLTLIVYEGGLSTSISSLKANLFLSSAVACTGVTAPIALSFLLKPMADATSLQAFAAGAALCSTSLGTTFTIMSVSGLTNTRLGIVLGTAAMEDDVIGLVMVQIITGLGGPDASIAAMTIVRPIAVSIGFAIILPLICVFLVKPVTQLLTRQPATGLRARLLRSTKIPLVVLMIHTLILLGLISGASYAETSTLFAAYLAGACISWFDETSPFLVSHGQTPVEETCNSSAITTAISPVSTINGDVGAMVEKKLTGVTVYEKYYAQPLNKIFKPFFFASVGFSIPITHMFSGAVVWRGIVYSMLMALGKLLCGIWFIGHTTGTVTESDHAEPDIRRSLYSAAILGSAMVARGKIGFLGSSLAASNGIFDPRGNAADVFLIVTWAIVLCTILGPVAVGLLMRRLRAWQKRKDRIAARANEWDTFRDWNDGE
ncbi:hypothetical protein EV356DRAFT_522721 [Viridothelium virens]|uniref:Cation/H+ exchanger transmembrane domain-containing protein n=1 Tax=Viridothelium virens TaxID=1048519 RepID=A0A6A6HDG7_VIRVR|nr:hypothetical protein EV356DRAFT_522721 [Viridothelium virens]